MSKSLPPDLEHDLSDVERGAVLAEDVARQQIVLCEIRADELRTTMAMCEAERQGLAGQLHAVNARKARLAELLRNGSHH